MNLGDQFRFTLFTNRPGLAAAADCAGVDRVGLDLELLGKLERQRGLGTWISSHAEAELPCIFATLGRARRFVRCNPPHPGLALEIERLLVQGAEVIMLPYFHTVAEAEHFAGAIDGRASAVLLVETAAAASRVGELGGIQGIDEIHFGLNDLALDLGVKPSLAMLYAPLLEDACAALKAQGFPYAVGGIGRAGDASLPVPADLVYAQYPRLGATGALLSRAFYQDLPKAEFPLEVVRARQRLNYWAQQSPAELRTAREALRDRISALTGTGVDG